MESLIGGVAVVEKTTHQIDVSARRGRMQGSAILVVARLRESGITGKRRLCPGRIANDLIFAHPL
ncbi:MAG TPA: hypothetical protein VM118_13220 [Acidobacteriota bacterium]|nr:hypothetical protein [Acidobacteriota bacterium]